MPKRSMFDSEKINNNSTPGKPAEVSPARRSFLALTGTAMVGAAGLLLTTRSAYADGGGDGGGGDESPVEDERWGDFQRSLPNVTAAVQQSAMSEERKTELLNMLEQGKQAMKRSRSYGSAGDKNMMKANADDAMSLLGEVQSALKSASTSG